MTAFQLLPQWAAFSGSGRPVRCVPVAGLRGPSGLDRLLQIVEGLLGVARGEDLEGWIEQVRQHDLPALRQFADGLLHDWDAVVAGLSSPWSSDQVEGQATRVKLLKRAGYGRAKLDLLRTRILLRA